MVSRTWKILLCGYVLVITLIAARGWKYVYMFEILPKMVVSDDTTQEVVTDHVPSVAPVVVDRLPDAEQQFEIDMEGHMGSSMKVLGEVMKVRMKYPHADASLFVPLDDSNVVTICMRCYIDESPGSDTEQETVLVHIVHPNLQFIRSAPQHIVQR